MKWHTYKTIYSFVKDIKLDERHLLEIFHKTKSPQAGAEYVWATTHKPFFNIWPMIGEGLCKTNLDIDAEIILAKLLKLPMCLNIRFAEGHEVDNIQTILVNRIKIGGLLGLSIFTFTGELGLVAGDPIYNMLHFPIVGTIEKSLTDLPRKDGINEVEYQSCITAVRIVTMLALMFDNPDLIESIILRGDAIRGVNERTIDRAKRRGIVGWNVGSHIEISPHYRRPHFAIRWTGKGGTIPKVVPIKGVIVKRSKATSVPTGFEET
jgi:hypothetical protein